jgi:hypothetical protein
MKRQIELLKRIKISKKINIKKIVLVDKGAEAKVWAWVSLAAFLRVVVNHYRRVVMRGKPAQINPRKFHELGLRTLLQR